MERLKPSKVLPAMSLVPLKIEVPKGLLHELILRRNGKEGTRDLSELNADVAGVLDRLGRVDETARDCKTCGFHEHASMYNLLIDLLDGELQERALKDYVGFLANASMQYDDPIEWIAQVQLVLRLTRTASKEDMRSIERYQKGGKLLVMAPHGNDNSRKILEVMRQTGNQILSLYARTEEVSPRVFTWQN